MEFSGKHSFTVYPSLDPYRWTERQTETEYTRCAWAGGTFFPVVLLCHFFVLAGTRFWFYILMYITQQIILRTNIFLIVVEVLAMFFGGHFNLRKFLLGFFIYRNN